MPNQSDLHQTIRASTSTTLDYNGDWHKLFDNAGIAAGPYNGRLLDWINAQLVTNYTNLPQAMNAFAVSKSKSGWSAVNSK